MNNKLINKEIRKASAFSSLPVLIFTIIMLIYRIVIPMIFSAMYKIGITPKLDVYLLIAYSFQYLIVASFAIFMFYITRGKYTGLKIKQVFCKPQKSVDWITKWIIITMAFSYIASFLTNIFRIVLETVFNIELNTPDFDFGNTGLGIFAMFLALSVFAPFFEELMFRATIYRNTEIMGQGFAMIFTGVIFGLWHENYQQFLFAAVMGTFASFIFSKTRSIYPVMILHCIMNTLAAIVQLSSMSLDTDILESGNVKYMLHHLPQVMLILMFELFVIGIVIAGITLFIVEIVKHGKELKLRKGIFPIEGFRKISVFFSSPVTIITFVMLITLTIMNAFDI